MTTHRHWFYKYEELKGGDVLLQDDSSKRTIGQGKVQLILKDGRRETIPSVLHIPISKMQYVSIQTMFEKYKYKMVRGVMVLMWGIRIRTLYKMLGKRNGSSCFQVVNPKTDKILSCVANLTMLWHRQMGHINQNVLCAMHSKGMAKGILDCSLEFDLCEHCI